MVENKKIALVTGGSSGIGSAIAIELAKKNVHVIITGKTLSGLEITESKIKLDGGTSTIAQLDLNDFVGIDRLGMEIFKKWGKLDILISNAAVLGTLGPLHHQSSEEFFDVINVNYKFGANVDYVGPYLMNEAPIGSFPASGIYPIEVNFGVGNSEEGVVAVMIMKFDLQVIL